MQRFLKRYLLWFAWAVFLMLAYIYGSREGLLATESPYAAGKYIIFLVFICFVAYSIYATQKENFFRSVVTINSYKWGLQIGLDLYISVFLSLAVIYLNEGSFIILLLWLVPVLFFANLAILPYILMNYGSLVDRFVS